MTSRLRFAVVAVLLLAVAGAPGAPGRAQSPTDKETAVSLANDGNAASIPMGSSRTIPVHVTYTYDRTTTTVVLSTEVNLTIRVEGVGVEADVQPRIVMMRVADRDGEERATVNLTVRIRNDTDEEPRGRVFVTAVARRNGDLDESTGRLELPATTDVYFVPGFTLLPTEATVTVERGGALEVPLTIRHTGKGLQTVEFAAASSEAPGVVVHLPPRVTLDHASDTARERRVLLTLQGLDSGGGGRVTIVATSTSPLAPEREGAERTLVVTVALTTAAPAAGAAVVALAAVAAATTRMAGRRGLR